MGIVTGAMTVARFRVEGELVDGWREIYRERLQEHAFKEPPTEMGHEEVEGWVEVHNLLDATFEDYNRWLYNDVAVFALRIDKKRLPAKLFKATLQKKCEAWAEERGLERVPAAVRSELKDELEQAWLKRTLPAVSVTEAAWNLTGRYCILHSLSEGRADRFRTRFYRTFGLTLVPWSPLDYVSDDRGRVDALLSCAPSPVRLGGADVRLSEGGA